MLSALAPSSANESCSPACRPLVPVCAMVFSNDSRASGFRVIDPPIATVLSPGDLYLGRSRMPCYERNPGTRPGFPEPLQNQLASSCETRTAGLCIIDDRRLSCRSTGEGWEERQIKPAGTRLLCCAMLPASICGSLIPDKKAAQHLSCAATE
jgi:hypothetical protein